MARLTAHDLVQLPKIDPSSAVWLGERLLAAAEAGGDLPAPIARAAEALRAAHADLVSADAPRRAHDPRVHPDALRAAAADRAIDAAWAALHDWLTGWSKLPGGAPEAHKARAILADILPQGLAFTRIAHELEWAESEARLAGIAQRKLDLPIRDLGGAPFLDALRDAHRHYGEALGLPHPAHERDQVSDSLEDFLDALRTYVVRVTAHVDRDDPATIALAEQLLAPLTGGPRRAGSPA